MMAMQEQEQEQEQERKARRWKLFRLLVIYPAVWIIVSVILYFVTMKN